MLLAINNYSTTSLALGEIQLFQVDQCTRLPRAYPGLTGHGFIHPAAQETSPGQTKW